MGSPVQRGAPGKPSPWPPGSGTGAQLLIRPRGLLPSTGPQSGPDLVPADLGLWGRRQNRSGLKSWCSPAAQGQVHVRGLSRWRDCGSVNQSSGPDGRGKGSPSLEQDESCLAGAEARRGAPAPRGLRPAARSGHLCLEGPAAGCADLVLTALFLSLPLPVPCR